jgi:hypothetical protein
VSVGVAKEKIVSKLNRAEINTLMIMMVIVVFGLLYQDMPTPTLVVMTLVFFIALYGFNTARSDEPAPRTYWIVPNGMSLSEYISKLHSEDDEDDEDDDEYYYGRGNEILQ